MLIDKQPKELYETITPTISQKHADYVEELNVKNISGTLKMGITN